MAIAKVIYKESSSATGEVWMDVTQKTVTSATMLSDITALKNDGTGVVGNIALKSVTNLKFSSSTATFVVPSGYYSGAINWTITSKGAETFTPAETAQTIASYQWLTGSQTIAAISSTYVGTGISRCTATNLTANGSTITTAAGYYSSAVSKAVGGGTATTPATTITANPTVFFNTTTGVFTATASTSSNVTPTVTAGYISAGTAGKITVSGTSTYSLSVQAAKTITPTEEVQIAVSAHYYTTDPISVAAISSWYVGTGVPVGDRSTITFDSETAKLKVDAGYYGGVYYYTLTSRGAVTIYPSTAQQTILSGRYLTGTQTFASVVTSNLEASYIASGINVKVGDSANAGRIANITGTYQGGGGGEDYLKWAQNAEVINKSSSYLSTLSYIGSWAFAGREFSGSISFNSVTQIGYRAFYMENRTGIGSVCSFNFPLCSVAESNTFAGRMELTYLSMPLLSIVPISMCYDCISLYSIYLPECTEIRTNAFSNCQRLSRIDIPKCEIIGAQAFEKVGTEIYGYFSVSLPECTSIGWRAFSSCTRITDIYAPKCTTLSGYAFFNCRSLSTITLGNVSSIPENCFRSCDALKSLDLTYCEYVGQSAFVGAGIESVYAPSCSFIGLNAFTNCEASIVDIPECTGMSTYAFDMCYRLISINAPKLTSISAYAFSQCSSLTYTNFDACEKISGSAFYKCSNIATISLPKLSSIYNYAFYSCPTLESVYLMGSSVATALGSRIFYNTPIDMSSFLGYFGSIYVPSSLAETYKSATNWSYYSSRIVGI